MAADLDFYIGSRVKSRRSALGITQDKLGNYLGVTYQQIQKYENGVDRISASTLYNIASALSIDIAYFFDGYHGYSPSNEDNVFNTESSNLLRAFYKIQNSVLRKKIIAMIKAFSTNRSGENPTPH
jgi:transcriptional regulator with XRE-family HTH domain